MTIRGADQGGNEKGSLEIDERLQHRRSGRPDEEAFLEVLGGHARREEVAALSEMRGMEHDDPDVMASAWRT